MWSIRWPVHLLVYLLFIVLKQDRCKVSFHYILTQRSLRYYSAKENNLFYPISALLPPPTKNPFTSQTTSKNTCFFSVNCSLETWRCVWRILLSMLLISKFPSGSQRTLPKWAPLKVGMDLAIWHRWCHLWNSTWHLQHLPLTLSSSVFSGCLVSGTV